MQWDGKLLLSEHGILVNAGGLSCVSSLEGVHLGTVLSIKAGERLLAVGAADNSMSLFHRSEQLQAGRVPPWKLLRTPPRAAAVVTFLLPFSLHSLDHFLILQIVFHESGRGVQCQGLRQMWAHAGEMCGSRCGKRSDLQWGPQWFASSLGACSGLLALLLCVFL
jgi:hypothetical protein